MSGNNFSDFGINQPKTGKPLQIYTLAHAVRSRQIQTSPKLSDVCIGNENKRETSRPTNVIHCQHPVSDSSLSAELKETVQIKHKVTLRKQPRSTLPMKMIVSKRATRKPVEESLDSYNLIEPSTCRYYKLTPPSWHCKSNFSKRKRPTDLENTIEDMKKRCVEFNVQTNDKAIEYSSNNKPLDLEGLLHSQRNKENILLNTPRNEHAYNQLYGKQSKINHTSSMLSCDQVKQWDQPANIHSQIDTDKQLEEKFVFNPRCSSVSSENPKFVWNPVILKDQSTNQLSSLFESRSETFDFLWENQKNNGLQHNSNFQSPVTPSSSSSGQTVAEENLRILLYTKQAPYTYEDTDYQSSVFMPRMFKTTSQSLRNTTRTTSIFNYPQVSELSRFYEE